MPFTISLGVRNGALANTKALLDGGKIQVYGLAAAVPATPDDAIPAGSDLLIEYTNNGTATGLTFDAPADGVMLKAAAEVWSGTTLATGTAVYYRHVSPSDTGAATTTEARLQGNVGTVNADLIVSTTTFTISEVRQLNYYAVGEPAS